jgi:hypothetical protein
MALFQLIVRGVVGEGAWLQILTSRITTAQEIKSHISHYPKENSLYVRRELLPCQNTIVWLYKLYIWLAETWHTAHRVQV